MWFRFYTETLDDPKVQRLSAELFRSWVNLLCIAKKYDGKLPSEIDCAFMLRVTPEAFHETFAALNKAGLFDEKGGRKRFFEPHNWSNRQYKSDSSTERVKQFRKRQCNVSVTPRAHDRTETETETEYRTEKKEEDIELIDSQPIETSGQISENPTDIVSENLQVISDAGSSKAVVKTRADQFGMWWPHWTIIGTKRGKEGARRKFKVVMKNGSPTLDELCDGLDRYMAYCAAENTEVQHIIHPERFLTKGYWNNDYPAPRRTEGDVLQDLYEKYQRKDAEDGDVR